MWSTLALLCVLSGPAFGEWEGDLKLRYGSAILGIPSPDAFLAVPRSDEEALRRGWTQVEAPVGRPTQGALANLTLWSDPIDYSIGVYIDDTGYTAGLNIALNLRNIYNVKNDTESWTYQGFTFWNVTRNGQSEQYWTMQQYYVTPEFLEIPAAVRKANRNSYVFLQDRQVLVSSYNGTLYRIPTRVNEIMNPAWDFTRQNCVQRKGRIYLYRMTPSTQCTPDMLLPWFPMIYDRQLIGLGFYTSGRHIVYPSWDPRTNYFENASLQELRDAVPNGPKCLYEIPQNPGLLVLHIYFIRHPYQMTCLFN